MDGSIVMTFAAQSDFPQDLALRYRYISLLGRGGMGVVYRVYDNSLGKEVAIKTLPGGEISAKRMMRFQKEAKAIGRLGHPNLVSVYDFGIMKSGQPYMVMELVEGASLTDYLHANDCDLASIIHIMLQILAAVAHAHKQGVLHRDLKPFNIILEEPQSRFPTARVIDFGVAQLRNPDERAGFDSTGGVGSPAYMSPESTGGNQVDARADVYSLGCLFFECLTGRVPFESDSVVEIARMHTEANPPKLKDVITPWPIDPASESLTQIDKEIWSQLETIISKCLEKSPDSRFQSVEQLWEEVSEVADKVPEVEINKAKILPDTAGGAQVYDKVVRQTSKFLPSVGRSRNVWITASILGFSTIIMLIVLCRSTVNEHDGLKESSTRSLADFDENFVRFTDAEKTLEHVLKIEHHNATDAALKDGTEVPVEDGFALAQSSVSDEGLKYLIGKTFYKIDLSFTKVTNEGMQTLAKIPMIERIKLEGLPIQDSGVEKLKDLKLQAITLRQTQITDKSLEVLSKIKTLNSIDLSACDGITDSGVAHLAALPNLHILYLDYSHVSIKPLLKLKKLIHLSYSYKKLADDDIRLLCSSLKNLEKLQITDSNITSRSFDYLLEEPLHDLRIADCPKITKEDIDNFVQRYHAKYGYNSKITVQTELPYFN